MNAVQNRNKSQGKLSAALLLAAVAVPCLAQTALTPDSPALPPGSISPAVSPSSPALSSSFGSATTSSSSNLSIAGLAELLAGLQTQLEQTLPVLNAFNNSFDFISVGSLGNANGTSGGTGANFSSSLGQNFSSSAGVNLSSSMGVSTANTQSGTSLNAFGLPPGLGVAPITSETLRSLLVLQNAIQSILPTLSALNGVTNTSSLSLTPGFTPGAITNVFMVPAAVR